MPCECSVFILALTWKRNSEHEQKTKKAAEEEKKAGKVRIDVIKERKFIILAYILKRSA
jgi:hypothetical protein